MASVPRQRRAGTLLQLLCPRLRLAAEVLLVPDEDALLASPGGEWASLGLRGGVHMETPIDSTLALFFVAECADFHIHASVLCQAAPGIKRKTAEQEK